MNAIEQFVDASEEGDVQTMSALLPKVDVNAANSEGWTALLKAAFVGQFAAAQWLVKSAGVDVDRARVTDDLQDGATPLYLACCEGKKDVVQVLIGAGADLNKAKKWGFTPLHAACENHPDIAELLIRAGADVNKAADDGATPYDYGRGNATLAKLLLDAGAVGTFNGFTLAAGHGDVETMKQFEGVDVNQADGDDWTALQRAAYMGQLEAVQWLIDVAGADIERARENGSTPLYVACETGKNEVAQYLIGKGAGVNKANKSDMTPLWMGAQQGHDAVVILLIAAGADLNKAESHGTTPLWVAAQNGHDTAVKSLIAAGADFNKAMNGDSTALFISAQHGHDARVKSLIAAGADLNRRKGHGWTVLHKCVAKGDEAMIKLLVEAGADLFAVTYKGRTPVWEAERRGHESIAQLLRDARRRVPVVGALFRASLLVFRTLRRSPLDVIALQRIAEAVAGDELVSTWLTDAERTRIFTASRVTHAVRVARAPQLAALDTVCARMAWLRESTPAYTQTQLEPLGARAARQRDLALAQWRAADAERVAAEQHARRVADRRAPPPSARATRYSSRKAAAKRRR